LFSSLPGSPTSHNDNKETAMADSKQLTVVYEHPHWFTPLFTELERRGILFRKVDASVDPFDPTTLDPDRDVVFNRISPSSWTRGRGALIATTQRWLRDLEAKGVDVINGADTFDLEISKAAQLRLLRSIGARAPRTRVVRDVAELPDASRELDFPLIVKPNTGGSGAGIKRFLSIDDLRASLAANEIGIPPGDLLLLQEYHPPRTKSIVRIETLDGQFLYAIRIHLGNDSGFDLCPADVCKTTMGEELSNAACAVDAQKQGLSVEAFEAPPYAVKTVEQIARASKLDVGGIEYLESDRDGEIYYYDVNALSNFVSDPLRVIGFDPTARLVDSIEERLGVANAALAGRAS
jgi:glutathione synthase/RimK-type ligase-like ATP-grasp enzyme